MKFSIFHLSFSFVIESVTWVGIWSLVFNEKWKMENDKWKIS